MASWRSIRRQARRDLHETMRVPALYYPDGPSGPAVPVRIRVWQGHRYLGDMKGTAFDFAELAENTPSVVTLDAEVIPKRGAAFAVEPGEVYRVDRREPKDDITSISHVVALSPGQAAAYEVPSTYDPTRLEIYSPDLARAFGFSFSASATLAGFPAPFPAPVQVLLDYTGAEFSGGGGTHVFDGTRAILLDGTEYLVEVRADIGGAAPGSEVRLWSNFSPGAPAWTEVLALAVPEYVTSPVRFSALMTGNADTEATGMELRLDAPASTVEAVSVTLYHAGS